MKKGSQKNNIIELKGFKGILWVGDPHLWSKNPGSRLAQENFMEVVLDKISQSIEIAIRDNLYLIFAGDLFDDCNENSIELTTKIIRLLKSYKNRAGYPAATVEGNHEKKQTKYTDDVITRLLQEADLLYTMEENGIWGELTIEDFTLEIGSTPYGEKIPSKINRKEKVDCVMWLTHHNLDFGETYPGVELVKEIEGVDILINGHIHKLKKPIRKGKMIAYNPGNITRLSIDCKDHIPQVWKWYPESPTDIVPETLKYKKDVFRNKESLVKLNQENTLQLQKLDDTKISKFVQELQSFDNRQDEQTSDGTLLKEKIELFGKVKEAPTELVEFITDLLKDNNED